MENFTIKSKIISGSVTKTDDESSSNIEINIKIHEDIDPDCVVRAYFADKDTKEVRGIGVVDNFGHLAVRVNPQICTDTIIFGIKNTITDKVDYVGYAYQNEEWTLEDNTPVDNAKKILERIKSSHSAKLSDVQNDIFNEINENLKNYSPLDNDSETGFTLYKISDFKPVSSISAVKYAMFERGAMYSFDKFGHYIFGINENKILIAFASDNEANPLVHMDSLCTKLNIGEAVYFSVIIELADDGQYFIKD